MSVGYARAMARHASMSRSLRRRRWQARLPRTFELARQRSCEPSRLPSWISMRWRLRAPTRRSNSFGKLHVGMCSLWWNLTLPGRCDAAVVQDGRLRCFVGDVPAVLLGSGPSTREHVFPHVVEGQAESPQAKAIEQRSPGLSSSASKVPCQTPTMALRW